MASFDKTFEAFLILMDLYMLNLKRNTAILYFLLSKEDQNICAKYL